MLSHAHAPRIDVYAHAVIIASRVPLIVADILLIMLTWIKLRSRGAIRQIQLGQFRAWSAAHIHTDPCGWDIPRDHRKVPRPRARDLAPQSQLVTEVMPALLVV